jgi:membrane protein implicated in regulation of membrane protease activity
MSVLSFFLSGANLPFVFALGVSVLFVLLQWSGAMGLLGEGDADAEADVDADADADADAEADADSDGDDAEHHAAPLLKLPLTVRGPIAAIGFALTGFALNALTHGEAASLPPATMLWTLPAGLLAGYASSRMVTRLLAPILDDHQNAAPERKSLVGRIGTVISTGVNAEFGEVRIKDQSGHQLRVIVKLAEGSAAAREGDEIVVTELDERGTPRVTPLTLRLPAA